MSQPYIQLTAGMNGMHAISANIVVMPNMTAVGCPVACAVWPCMLHHVHNSVLLDVHVPALVYTRGSGLHHTRSTQVCGHTCVHRCGISVEVKFCAGWGNWFVCRQQPDCTCCVGTPRGCWCVGAIVNSEVEGDFHQ